MTGFESVNILIITFYTSYYISLHTSVTCWLFLGLFQTPKSWWSKPLYGEKCSTIFPSDCRYTWTKLNKECLSIQCGKVFLNATDLLKLCCAARCWNREQIKAVFESEEMHAHMKVEGGGSAKGKIYDPRRPKFWMGKFRSKFELLVRNLLIYVTELECMLITHILRSIHESTYYLWQQDYYS